MIPITVTDLRKVVEDSRHTLDVSLNKVTGNVEFWIDPPEHIHPTAAVANLRFTREQATAVRDALNEALA